MSKKLFTYIFKYGCLFLVVVLLFFAFFSRSIENMRLTSVTLATPYKGTIATPVAFVPKILRVRSQSLIVLEDVIITANKKINEGDPIATVYPKSVDEQLKKEDITEAERSYLSEIKKNDYQILAPEAGTVISVAAASDTKLATDDIIYKYMPRGEAWEKEILTSYDVIIPISALIPSTGDNYLVYYAVPLTGRGEAGQFIVGSAQVKILAQEGDYVAVDMAVHDGRQVIVSSEKPISPSQKVKVQ